MMSMPGNFSAVGLNGVTRSPLGNINHFFAGISRSIKLYLSQHYKIRGFTIRPRWPHFNPGDNGYLFEVLLEEFQQSPIP